MCSSCLDLRLSNLAPAIAIRLEEAISTRLEAIASNVLVFHFAAQCALCRAEEQFVYSKYLMRTVSPTVPVVAPSPKITCFIPPEMCRWCRAGVENTSRNSRNMNMFQSLSLKARKKDRQTDRQKENRKKERQTDRKKERQIERMPVRQTDKKRKSKPSASQLLVAQEATSNDSRPTPPEGKK